MDYFLYFEYHTVKFAPKHPHFSSPRVLFSSRSSNSLLARLVGVFLVFCFIDSLIKQSWGAYSYTVAFWFFPISRSCYRFRRFVLSTPEGIVLYYWKCFQRASLLSVRVVFRAPHTLKSCIIIQCVSAFYKSFFQVNTSKKVIHELKMSSSERPAVNYYPVCYHGGIEHRGSRICIRSVQLGYIVSCTGQIIMADC